MSMPESFGCLARNETPLSQNHVLTDILKGLLTEHKGRSVDVATDCFTVARFRVLREGLVYVCNIRLLLGVEPTTGE